MAWLDVYKHLLPRARAWNITIKKRLREFFEGLVGLPVSLKEYFDLVWLDIFPATTREIPTWEGQFAITGTDLTEQERRDRLDGAWKALGGQDPTYIQETLRAAGFDVYVHEWWTPATAPQVPAVTPVARVPLGLISDTAIECGEPFAECGEPDAECGNSIAADGYPLVNKIDITSKNYTTGCGETLMECGEPGAECGEFDGFLFEAKEYDVPSDSSSWPFFLYIGAVAFPDIASVAIERRDEFEDLCLKICPAQQWLGILVQYV